MKPLVLITRPQPEADNFAKSVRKLGYDTLCEPLLTITHFPVHIAGEYAAVIATSPQALSADLPTQIPLFVMGQASVGKARELGFTNTLSSDGEFEKLVSLVRGNVAAGSRVLYLRGKVTRHDMRDALSEYQVEEQIVYRAQPRAALSPEAVAAFAEGRVSIVTLFSPRTAALFQKFVQNEGLKDKTAAISLLSLSPAVLDSIDAFEWARTGVAASSNSEEMLAVLENWIGSFS